MSTNRHVMLVGCAVAAAVSSICLFGVLIDLNSPLRKPPEEIRSGLFKKTCVGTKLDEVTAFINSQGWQYHVIHSDEDGKTETFIVSDIGTYGIVPWEEHFPFATVVHVSWSFSKEQKLENITVSKYVDAP